jgi:glutathione S-transferase
LTRSDFGEDKRGVTLRLYYHPFSSFCQKVLVALYERDVPFEGELVGGGDPQAQARLEALWPMGKFPVLVDEARGLTVPESSVIIEYLDHACAGPPLVPANADAALPVRIWDRFFDNYVELSLQKVVGDTFRPEGRGDPQGIEDAKGVLAKAYPMIETQLARHGGDWATGDAFTLADCAAAPALFYANTIVPFAGHRRVEAYFERLLARPSFARAVDEARPYRHFFPLDWPDSYR